MNFDRLIELADLLENLPVVNHTDQFDYGSWVDENWLGHPDLSCGANACALGHAAAKKPEWGLRLKALHGQFELGYVTHVDLPQTAEEKLNSYERNDWSFQAAAKAFDITYDDAQFLFAPTGLHPDRGVDHRSPPDSASAKDVAKHIRDFVNYRRENPPQEEEEESQEEEEES